jgi:CubicO group peptidase (beta-lactamase class C family)
MRLVLPLLCACATVPKPPPIDASRIDAAAAKEIGDNKTAGVSVAVARGNEVVLARGYGLADVEAKKAATADTRYPIMSVSKAITAVAVLSSSRKGGCRSRIR